MLKEDKSKEELLLRTTSMLEMDGLLDIQLERLPLISFSLMLLLLEEMSTGYQEKSSHIFQLIQTDLNGLKTLSLEEHSLELTTYKTESLETAQLLDASTLNSTMLDLAMELTKLLLLLPLITSSKLSNGQDLPSLATMLTL